MDLYFEAQAPSEKPALLLVHGLLSSRLHWQPNAALAEHFRLVCVDLPGHGRSPKLDHPENARPENLVLMLEAVRKKLNIERWHVCGQSFGAGLSLLYALNFPDAILAHAFTNGNAALRTDWPEQARLDHDKSLEAIRNTGMEAIRKMRYHPARAHRFDDDIRQVLTQEAELVDPTTFLALQEVAIPALTVADRLSELSVPTLLINGVLERQFQPTRHKLAQTHPNISIVDLDGGHSINVENPSGFNQALTRFLEGHQGNKSQTSC